MFRFFLLLFLAIKYILNNQKNILIPIPNYGFDPTEVAIPWKLFSEAKFNVVFSTPKGEKAVADTLMLTGKKLGIWKSVLKAKPTAVKTYFELEKNQSFCKPLTYKEAKETNFNAIFLPGGHDKGVKEYLESNILQQLIVSFFKNNKPVGAICHGVVLLARSIDPKTGKSVLYNYKTTALLKKQELLAYNLTRLWLKDYYLTYPQITVEEEVTNALIDKNNFLSGKTPIFRDTKINLKRGFTVRDRNYLSARWPGDVYKFSFEFIEMIKE